MLPIDFRAVAAAIVLLLGVPSPAAAFVHEVIGSVVEDVEDTVVDVGKGIGKAIDSIGGVPAKAPTIPNPSSRGGGTGSFTTRGSGASHDGGGGEARASRIFGTREQYPPEDFAAYAIVAFPNRATSADRGRYLLVCEAYQSAIPHASELDLPREQQLATVWPIGDEDAAETINAAAPHGSCDDAVDAYDLATALDEIKAAEDAGLKLRSKKGPFLLAWSPPDADLPILYMDLSSKETNDELKRAFQLWVRDIEEDPSTWLDDEGWDIDKLKAIVRNWANELGRDVLALFEG